METNAAFSQFGLKENLIASLNSFGFENASPIQELTIPTILDGKDIFAQAETGSGKTGSFAIPILEQILRSDKPENTYIVLSPTRELAQQTYKVFNEFGKSLDIKAACVIGGESFDKQKAQLAAKPQIIVGTPGRLCDLMRQKFIDPKTCTCVVFDEADRLFEMGFKKDIEHVLKGVQKHRQLIMVSATNNQEVMTTAYKFHSNPEELKLNEGDLLVENINHEIAMISEDEKMPYLVHTLRENPDAYAIIFCNTQFMTHLVATWLGNMGFAAEAISGKLAQNRRTRLMEDFRSKKITILVCTDVAARGLDIKDVNLVINYDLPHEAPNYVHRIGRTGRAGKSGLAISFCGHDDCENLDDITEYIDSKIPKSDIEDHHFATDLTKKPRLDRKTLKVYEDKKPTSKKKPNNQSNQSTREKKEFKTKTPKPEKREPIVRDRSFVFTSDKIEQAQDQALKHFGITDITLLETEVLEEGKKKFIFFGGRSTKYQFKIKAIYKKILQPYLIELIKKMGLNIYVRVSFTHPNVRIAFSGKDAGQLVKNKFELQNAVAEIGLRYLWSKISIPRDVKVTFRTERADEKKKTEKYLVTLAQKTMTQVVDNKTPVLLKSLNPADRRIIHMHVKSDPKFTSTSVGDGRFKQIEISLK